MEFNKNHCKIEISQCIDRVGDFICVCKTGFEGDGHYCNNKDEAGF